MGFHGVFINTRTCYPVVGQIVVFDRYLMTERIEKAIKFLVNMSRIVRKNGLHNEISAHNMTKSNAQYTSKCNSRSFFHSNVVV